MALVSEQTQKQLLKNLLQQLHLIKDLVLEFNQTKDLSKFLKQVYFLLDKNRNNTNYRNQIKNELQLFFKSKYWNFMKKRFDINDSKAPTFESLLEVYLTELLNPNILAFKKTTTNQIVRNEAIKNPGKMFLGDELSPDTVLNFTVQKVINLARKLKDPEYLQSKLYVLKQQAKAHNESAKVRKIDMLLKQLAMNPSWQQLKQQYKTTT